MSSKSWLRSSSAGSAAVTVRLIAFLVAAAATVAIPSTLVATATGLVSHHSALIAMGSAAALILFAALAVRPFDPI